MRAKISKRTVDNLEAAERGQFLWDTELPGFGVKITPKGTHVYLMQYGQAWRVHRITIGRHGVEVTPEQARVEAQRLRGLVAAGEMPKHAGAKRSEDVTVTELGQRYIDEYATAHKRPSGIRKFWEDVCKLAEIDDLRLHDLRHSYASVGAAGGLSLPVNGALLGHSQPTTTARYAHLAAPPLHEAADATGNRIVAALHR